MDTTFAWKPLWFSTEQERTALGADGCDATLFKHTELDAEQVKETTTGVLRREEMSDKGKGTELEAFAMDGTLPEGDNITDPAVTCVLQWVPILVGATNWTRRAKCCSGVIEESTKVEMLFPSVRDSVTKPKFVDTVSGCRHFPNDGIVRAIGRDDCR